MKDMSHYRTFMRSETIIIILLTAGLLFVGCTSKDQKKPSPLRSDSAQVGEVTAYIEFSSPGVKGRKIFGPGESYLVPFEEIWRTGANNATFFSVSGAVNVGSSVIDSGTYSLFTIPGAEKWTIIINEEWQQWGSYNYKDTLDIVRLTVNPKYADQVQERMLFYFADDSLKFRWDKVRWAIPFTHRL